jgi:hypothetical protein
MRRRLSLLAHSVAAMLSISVANPALAAPQWCGGKIERMFHDAGGVVFIFPTFRNDWIAICNVNAAWQGVTPEVCRGWLSETLSVILGDKSVTIFYSDVPSCEAIPYYSLAPAPSYVMVHK